MPDNTPVTPHDCCAPARAANKHHRAGHRRYEEILRAFLTLLVLTLVAADSAAQDAVRPAAKKPVVHSGVYVDPAGNRRKVTYEVIDGRAIFQGDIDLGPVDKQGNFLAPLDETEAAGTVARNRVWPDCVVPIVMDASVQPPLRGNIILALQSWSAASRCRFPARTSETDHVVFVQTDLNSSPVGRMGGRQNIRLTAGASQRTVEHEVGHTLGLFHEHTRRDRDACSTILWANILEDKTHNFHIDPDTADLGLYNFASAMHYTATTFAKPGLTTIRPVVPGTTFGGMPLHAGDVSGALEVQSMYRGWSFFEPPKGPPPAASPAVLGALGETFYYEPWNSGGRDWGRLCRRQLPWFPPPTDCATTLPPEPLAGLPAATFGQRPIGEAAVFVRGADTGTYMEFRRDYRTDAAGGRFRLATARIGDRWTSNPAAIELSGRLFVFGLRADDLQIPPQPVVQFARTLQDLFAWSAPISLPPNPGGHISDPAVVSTRPNIWTLFLFDASGFLWAIEGDRDGNVVTPWRRLTDFSITGGAPRSGPSASLTADPAYPILVAARGPADHLFYCGIDPGLNVREDWRNVGGQLTSRPSVYGSGTGAYVVADIQSRPHWFRYWRP